MKYAFIRAHREEFGIRAMCRVLRVHFSGFHAWLKEPLSHRAQEDVRQTELIRDDARRDVFEYIELFCNSKRKHTNNGMQSPVDFEARQLKLNTAGV
ncbi:MAG: hypothetical protein HUJ27_01755 [Rhodobacteraceae bacterium]|nr:hypothetical protein [Paracoccaceae bacterium]